MHERLIEGQININETKSVNYTDQIESILIDQHPLEKLHQVSANISHFLKQDISFQLKKDLEDPAKKELAMSELIYNCLPTLDHILQGLNELGIKEQDLISFGFLKLTETINSWQPKEHPESISDHLKFIFAHRAKKQKESFVAKENNLKQSQFELIPLYFKTRNEYQKLYGKPPESDDWETINEMISKYSLSLTENQENNFNSLRYFKTDNDKSENKKDSTIDMLRVIHNQVATKTKNNISLGEDFSFEDKIIPTLFKEEIAEILKELPPRHQEIIKMRFGFINGKINTQIEISKIYKVRKQRIYQIQMAALKKLRESSHSEKLKSFFEEN